METRKKMYKAGKLWMTGTIATVAFCAGTVVNNRQVSAATADAESNYTVYVNDPQKEIKDQENMVNYAQIHVDQAQEQLKIAQKQADDANKINEEVNSQKINDTQEKINDTKEQLKEAQLKTQNLEEERNQYSDVVNAYYKADDEYKEALERENRVQTAFDSAKSNYYKAVSLGNEKEQNKAFTDFVNLQTPLVNAITDRQNKEKILKECYSTFEKARDREVSLNDKLAELNNYIYQKSSILDQLNDKLDSYRNANKLQKEAEFNLNKAKQSLEECKNYLTEQQNKLAEIKAKHAKKSSVEVQTPQDKNASQTQVTIKKNDSKGSMETVDQKETKQIDTTIAKTTNRITQNDDVQRVKDAQKTNDHVTVISAVNTTNQRVELTSGKNTPNVKSTTVPAQKNNNNTLPQTGNVDSIITFALGVALAMFGLALRTKKEY